MQINFMILCEYASRLANGAPMLAGIFRGIEVSEFPTRLGPFYLCFEIELDPHEAGHTYEFQLRLIDQDGNQLFSGEIGMEFNRRPDMAPIYGYFSEHMAPDVLIQSPGIYRFDLLHEETLLAQTRLEISE